jgi:hypothetical protein
MQSVLARVWIHMHTHTNMHTHQLFWPFLLLSSIHSAFCQEAVLGPLLSTASWPSSSYSITSWSPGSHKDRRKEGSDLLCLCGFSSCEELGWLNRLWEWGHVCKVCSCLDIRETSKCSHSLELFLSYCSLLLKVTRSCWIHTRAVL